MWVSERVFPLILITDDPSDSSGDPFRGARPLGWEAQDSLMLRGLVGTQIQTRWMRKKLRAEANS